jgi:hypothetical protein
VTFCYDHFTSMLIASSVPTALSLHRDDGSSPRLIAASMPDVSDERADEQCENIHLIGTQNTSFDSKLTFSTSGNVYTRIIRLE